MEKINKRKAKSLFNKGFAVYLCASKCTPRSYVGKTLVSNEGTERDFENLINHFSYYNCTKELGMRVSFYKPRFY